MPLKTLSRFILIPELKLEYVARAAQGGMCILVCSKARKTEYCPRCAHPSDSTYDHREVSIKDAPIHGIMIKLKIKKRRLWCKPCGKPFTEPVPGIRKNFCHTGRISATPSAMAVPFAMPAIHIAILHGSGGTSGVLRASSTRSIIVILNSGRGASNILGPR
ncbi:MAG: transposase family protein [Bdellovibrionales bacterium]|nr:transposase family protein [Bdellovibrionales bacterium]